MYEDEQRRQHGTVATKVGLLDEFGLLGRQFYRASKVGKVSRFFKEDAKFGVFGEPVKGVLANAKKGGWAMAGGFTKGLGSGAASFPKIGWDWSYGPLFPVLTAWNAYKAAKAPTGEKLGTFAGNMAGTYLGATIGAFFGGMPGALAGNVLLGDPIAHAITSFINKGQAYQKRQYQFETGGYVDFAAARTMRQAAVEELGGSLLNARTILGREAAYLHS